MGDPVTWFRKIGWLVRKFKDEFIDSMISHAYSFPYERKMRKKPQKSRGLYTRIYKTQSAEMGLTALPISEEAEVDEHLLSPGNTVYRKSE